ncbi:hypothetical protein CCP4SC76_2050001 [Gammaproteobacteria bacterium]
MVELADHPPSQKLYPHIPDEVQYAAQSFACQETGIHSGADAMAILIFHSDPPRAFMSQGEIPPDDIDLVSTRLVAIPESHESLRIGSGGENPSATIQLDNGDGNLTGFLANLSPGTRATLMENGRIRFNGAVATIKLAEIAEVGIDA